jgi:DNA-binding Xre family transcriptional regulator
MGTNEHVEFRAVVGFLKKTLRQRKITYGELSKQLGLSESGLKKIFSSQDCSFARLSQIAGALGLRLKDILVELDEAQLRSVQFSESQQQYFLKNIDVFHLFVKLVVERHSLESLKKEFNLKQSEVFRYLKKLDELNLIQLLPNDRIKLPPLFLVKDFGPGPLLEKTYQKWGAAIVSELAYPRFQASGQFIVRCFQMKNETYEELLDRLLALESEFLRRAVREMSVTPTDLKTVRFMWLTDQQSFVRDLY